MSPVSPWPALVALACAWYVALALSGRFGAPSAPGRFDTIDGLRGFLALFVALSHACIWYFHLRTGHWKAPPSNLYNQMGQGSVVMFFMITAFLFFTRILGARTTPIDWPRLYIARVLRLTPLYLLTMALLFALVAYLSNWEMQVSAERLMRQTLSWLTFTIPGAPPLNGVSVISIAGVTWTLPYEWLFYLALPLLGQIVGARPSLAVIAFSLTGCMGVLLFRVPSAAPLLAFASGVAAAYAVRFPAFQGFASGRTASLLALTCIGIAAAGYRSAFSVAPIALYGVAFACIAGGNSLFGLLRHPASRMLGEITYSVYLLHGLLLFALFHFLVGRSRAAAWEVHEHWLTVCVAMPFLVLLCTLTFRTIELPAIRSIDAVMRHIRRAVVRPSASP